MHQHDAEIWNFWQTCFAFCGIRCCVERSNHNGNFCEHFFGWLCSHASLRKRRASSHRDAVIWGVWIFNKLIELGLVGCTNFGRNSFPQLSIICCSATTFYDLGHHYFDCFTRIARKIKFIGALLSRCVPWMPKRDAPKKSSQHPLVMYRVLSCNCFGVLDETCTDFFFSRHLNVTHKAIINRIICQNDPLSVTRIQSNRSWNYIRSIASW